MSITKALKKAKTPGGVKLGKTQKLVEDPETGRLKLVTDHELAGKLKPAGQQYHSKTTVKVKRRTKT